MKSHLDTCLEAGSRRLVLKACNTSDKNQTWLLVQGTSQIRSQGGSCLDTEWPHTKNNEVSLGSCSPDKASQRWNVVPTQEATPPSNVLQGFAIVGATVIVIALLFCVLVPLARAQQKQTPVKTEGSNSEPVAVSQVPVPRIPQPVPRAVLFRDPRPNTAHPIGICGFSDRRCEDRLDELCGCTFLGNCYELTDGLLELEISGTMRNFTNAEAAFQALRFSTVADEFVALSGQQALERAHELSGMEDHEYGGYSTMWKAMFAVLKAKFKRRTPMGVALEKTGDDFLLCHSTETDSDVVWSNNCIGDGTNWLGMQLMLIRANRLGWKRWTLFVESQVDVLTGRPLYGKRQNEWQAAVQSATAALQMALSTRSKTAAAQRSRMLVS